MSEANQVERPVRHVSEREMALALVLEFAETNSISFSLMGFYDDDIDFLSGLAERLGVQNNQAFKNKLTRVVRRLVNYGVFRSRMQSTSKEYIDEPAKQMNYRMKTGKSHLLTQPERPGITMGPEREAAFLLRYAYPAPDA